MSRLLVLMQICAVDRGTLDQALALNLPDFEDAVQIPCAIASDLPVIVTRDATGFESSLCWLYRQVM